MSKKKFRPILIVKGLLMGTADIIPGVSGGTLALITGIYDELVQSIRDVGGKTLASPFMLLAPKYRKEGWEEFTKINWAFLIPLGIGVLSAVLALSKIIPQLLIDYPLAMFSLFFGLILASVIFPWRMVETRGPEMGLAFAGGAIAFVIAGTEQLSTGTLNPLVVFISGAIAITAMILPGISGSYLLVIMGQYQVMLEAIDERQFVTIGAFIAGMAIGILSFARVLGWLLDHHRSPTMAVLAGFMVGSLRKVWPGNYWSPTMDDSMQVFVAGGFIALGVAVVLVMDYFGKEKKAEVTT